MTVSVEESLRLPYLSYIYSNCRTHLVTEPTIVLSLPWTQMGQGRSRSRLETSVEGIAFLRSMATPICANAQAVQVCSLAIDNTVK